MAVPLLRTLPLAFACVVIVAAAATDRSGRSTFRSRRRFPTDWIACAVICLALVRAVLKSARPPHRSNVLQVGGPSGRPCRPTESKCRKCANAVRQRRARIQQHCGNDRPFGQGAARGELDAPAPRP